MKELIQLSDLKIVGQLSDNILLLLESKNIGKQNPSAVQLNLGNNTYKIDSLQKFLKFTPFDEVEDNNDINKYYRDIIYRKLSDETIYYFLNELTEASAIDTIFKAYDNGVINNDTLQKAISKYGNNKHIERVKVERNGKVFYENRNVGGGKEGEGKPEKQYSEEELKDHAKSSPQKDLERHISEGTDESMRKVAHEELKRREDEEHVPEEDKLIQLQEQEKISEKESKKIQDFLNKYDIEIEGNITSSNTDYGTSHYFYVKNNETNEKQKVRISDHDATNQVRQQNEMMGKLDEDFFRRLEFYTNPERFELKEIKDRSPKVGDIRRDGKFYEKVKREDIKKSEEEDKRRTPYKKFSEDTNKDWVEESIRKLPSIYREMYDTKNYEVVSLKLKDLKPTQEGEDRINESSKYEATKMKEYLDNILNVEEMRKEDLYPILVDADTKEILDGNHRYSAYEMLGFKNIDAISIKKKLKDIKKSEEEDLSYSKEQLEELIKEHENLVSLLSKYSDKEDLNKELEKQKKELEGYKNQLESLSDDKEKEDE